MNAQPKTKIVHINVERGASGAYFATSPQLKGLLVSKMTLEEVHTDIPRAIHELFAVCGVEVFVTPADEDGGSEYEHPWVAMPIAVARRAMADA